MNIDEIFIDIDKLPGALSQEDTEKLFLEVQNGKKEARDSLVLHNIKLVLSRVNSRFKNLSYEKCDLVSIGNIGLIKAIDNYKIDSGYNFSTYATRCIDNEILMFLRKNKKEKDTNIGSLEYELLFKDGAVPVRVIDTLRDDTDIEASYEEVEMRNIIRKMVDNLPDDHKEIIMLHYGFCDGKIYTYKEISDLYHHGSRSNVCKKVKCIKKKLYSKFLEDGIVEYNPKVMKKK